MTPIPPLPRSRGEDEFGTLRDWFAGMAMQGFMVNGGVTYLRSWDDFARDAYYQADAMLAAREVGE